MVAAAAVAMFRWFAWLALAARRNHDESQYLGGAVLAAHALPFRDFLALPRPVRPPPIAVVSTLHGMLLAPSMAAWMRTEFDQSGWSA